MNFRRAVLALAACAVLSASPAFAQITGGMWNPDIDPPGQPFSYFARPTDVIGTLYAPAAVEVTPEGYVYTGFGELMFYVDNPPQPIDQRVKTLYKGYLPVVQYQLTRNQITYSFTLFAADLGSETRGLPVTFVKVEMKNRGKDVRTGFLTSAYRFTGPANGLSGRPPDYRFNPKLDILPADLVEGQSKFNPGWQYSFQGNRLLRDGRLLYYFPVQPRPNQLSLSLGDRGIRVQRFFTGEIRGDANARHTTTPTLPMGLVNYRVQLKAGESQTLVFKMPLIPLPENSGGARKIDAADCDEHLQKTAAFWEDLVSRRSPISIPEKRVQDYLLANTITILLAIDKVGENYIPNVNKFQYHTFYAGGDTCYMMNALDFMGQHDSARKALMYSLTTQRDDGAFVMPRDPTAVRYWESFGWSLWGWGRHYRLTRDREFLNQVYPGVQKAVAWQRSVTSQDSLGLLPPPTSEIADDAYLKSSRQTGQHIWVLIGLKNAIRMAEAAGNTQDAAVFQQDFDRFWAAFERLLNAQTAKSGGYIPPALDLTLEGNDWDNLHLLWPEPLFEPFDKRVTATLKRSRSEYVEGILDFVLPRAISREGWVDQAEGLKQDGYTFETARSLHYWQTQNNSMNHLVRGAADDQELAVRDLYAQLLHTTSTHAPQEFGTYPWSTRDFEGAAVTDILPDGPASGKTIEQIRYMLVREYQNDLYLLSALSPAWVQPGKAVHVRNQPTDFGPFTMSVTAGEEGSLDLALSGSFRTPPGKIVVTVPWFYDAKQAEVDGKPAKIVSGKISVSPGAKSVRIMGAMKPNAPTLSFDRAVSEYKAEYRRRYQEFLRTGQTRP